MLGQTYFSIEPVVGVDASERFVPPHFSYNEYARGRKRVGHYEPMHLVVQPQPAQIGDDDGYKERQRQDATRPAPGAPSGKAAEHEPGKHRDRADDPGSNQYEKEEVVRVFAYLIRMR